MFNKEKYPEHLFRRALYWHELAGAAAKEFKLLADRFFFFF